MDANRSQLRLKVIRTWDRWVSRTTFHGAKDFALSLDNRFFLPLWSIVLTSVLSFFVFEAYQSISNYLSSPYATSVQVEAHLKEPLKLPFFTICPFRPFKQSTLTRLGVSDDAANFLESALLTDVSHDPHDAHVQYWQSRNLGQLSHELDNLADKLKIIDDGSQTNEWFYDLFVELGFKCEDLLKECTNGTSPGAPISFNCCAVAIPTVTDFGLCYSVGGLAQTSPGFGNGLRVVVNPALDDQAMLIRSLPNSGIIVQVTEIERQPTVHRHAFLTHRHRMLFVKQGSYNSLQIDATRYDFENFNNSCHPEDRVRSSNSKVDFVPYSDLLCANNCTTIAVKRNCGCVPLVPVGLLFGDERFSFCSPATIQTCVNPILEKIRNESEACEDNCLPRCKRWVYRTAISALDATSSLFIDSDKALALLGAARKPEVVHPDWVTLDLHFRTLEHVHIQHIPTFTWDSLIGVIGGQLGLCCGVSIVTVLQIFFYLFQTKWKVGVESWKSFQKRRTKIDDETL